MKESFYQWVKTLAVFYILFSAVLHLIPDPKYERYIRSFMGLLLIYILCTPVLPLSGGRANWREFFPADIHRKCRRLRQRKQKIFRSFICVKVIAGKSKQKSRHFAKKTE